jgi:hypothetical protein
MDDTVVDSAGAGPAGAEPDSPAQTRQSSGTFTPQVSGDFPSPRTPAGKANGRYLFYKLLECLFHSFSSTSSRSSTNPLQLSEAENSAYGFNFSRFSLNPLNLSHFTIKLSQDIHLWYIASYAYYLRDE